MPRGHPDWQVQTGQFSFVDFDTAELAARVGSPDTLQRSGRVMFLDGFECRFVGYVSTLEGTGAAIDRIITQAFMGGACLRFTPGTTGNQRAFLDKYIPLIKRGTVGVEVLVWGSTNAFRFSITIDAVFAGRINRFVARWAIEAQTIDVFNSAGGVQNLLSGIGDMTRSFPFFQYLKLVVNLNPLAYDYVQFNDSNLDASAFTPQDIGADDADIIRVTLTATDLDATAGLVYVDNLIVTMDEP